MRNLSQINSLYFRISSSFFDDVNVPIDNVYVNRIRNFINTDTDQLTLQLRVIRRWERAEISSSHSGGSLVSVVSSWLSSQVLGTQRTP